MWAGAKWPLLLAAACICACAPARAGDWLINSHIGETVEANDNPQQLPKSPGGAVGSLTHFSLDAIDETPTLRLGFGTDLALREYTGPGAQSSLDGLQGDARAFLDTSTKLTDYHLDGSWQLAPAAVSELTDSGILAANTTRTTYLADGGLKHQLNDLNALGWSVSGTSVTFSSTNGGLVPFNDVVSSESWIRNLTPLTNFTAAVSTQWYQADSPTNTGNFVPSSNETVVQTATGQIDSQLTDRLKIMGRAGGGVSFASETLATPSGQTDVSNTSSNFVAGASLVYELKNTTFSANASHDFVPSSVGQVQAVTAVGISVDHKINEWSGLLFSGQFFDQLPSASLAGQSNQRQAMILSLAYSRNLMRDWDMLVSYRFVQQDLNDDTFAPFRFDNGSSTSNAVFVTLNRNINFFR